MDRPSAGGRRTLSPAASSVAPPLGTMPGFPYTAWKSRRTTMASTPRHGADPLGPVLDAIRPGLAMLGFPAYVIDADQRYRFVNAAYEVHFARKASELVGRSVTEIYGPPPADGRRQPLLR